MPWPSGIGNLASVTTIAPTGTQATPEDRRRQVAVTVSEVLCLLGTMLGVGVFGGTSVADAAGGTLSASATLVAPATTAFSIWTPIYLGLAAYTVWQWLPGQSTDPRHRRVGWLVAGSMLLNALWLLVAVQVGSVWGALVVIAALLAVLVEIVRRLHERPSSSALEAIVVDGTFGLYLGWVSVATLANLAGALGEAGLNLGVAVALLVAATAANLLLARRFGGRYAVALAAAWGLAWVSLGRSQTDPGPRSTPVALLAAVAAIVVLVAAIREHRSASVTA